MRCDRVDGGLVFVLSCALDGAVLYSASSATVLLGELVCLQVGLRRDNSWRCERSNL
jgi:hypothetical protein